MRTAALLTPWAITQEGLRLVLAVATRGQMFAEDLAQARARQDVDAPARQGGRHRMAVEDGVAVIKVQGPLLRHADMFSDISGATSYGGLRRQFQTAMGDPACRGVLLKIDSPGGEANGVADLAAQIRAWDAQKPVVAYVEGQGCSAAYWLATAARKVYCGPTAFLGSIGTRAVLYDDSEQDAKNGLREIEIVSSQSPAKRGRPIDDEVLARVQVKLDDLTDLFVGAVAGYRDVKPEKVLEDFGQGDYLIAQKAVAAGMADQIGTYAEALAEVRRLAAPPPVKTTAPPRARSASMKTLSERLDAMAGDSQQTAEMLRDAIKAAANDARTMEAELVKVKTDLVGATARAEKADYEELVRQAKADDDGPNARKITSPAQEQKIRELFTSSADLQRHLAATQSAPRIQPAQPASQPASKGEDQQRRAQGGAAPQLRSAIEAAMDAAGKGRVL